MRCKGQKTAGDEWEVRLLRWKNGDAESALVEDSSADKTIEVRLHIEQGQQN